MAKLKINKIMKKILGVKRPLKMGVKRPGCETTGNLRGLAQVSSFHSPWNFAVVLQKWKTSFINE